MTATWVWSAVGLAFATWAVALGGIASLQADCENNTYALASAGVRGFSSGLACKKLYRYYWFMIAFEFVIISGVALSLVAGLFRKTRVSWLGLFAVSALLYIQATDSFLTSRDRSFFHDGTPGHRMKTALAGYLMTAVANCFVIIALGLEPEGAVAGKGDTVQATAV